MIRFNTLTLAYLGKIGNKKETLTAYFKKINI